MKLFCRCAKLKTPTWTALDVAGNKIYIGFGAHYMFLKRHRRHCLSLVVGPLLVGVMWSIGKRGLFDFLANLLGFCIYEVIYFYERIVYGDPPWPKPKPRKKIRSSTEAE
jgi:hypothetical protein